MKKIFLILTTSVFLLSGCTDLDVNPTSQITDKNYWQTDEHFDAFMYGMHTRFRSHSWSFLLLGEGRSDIFGDQPFGGEASEGMERFPYNTITYEYPGISNYGEFYTNINQINLFIKKLKDSNVVLPEDKSYYLGQAYAMRAYYFFHIIRTWGDAVYTEEPSESFEIGKLDKAATPASEIMANIKSDLEQSIIHFGSNYSMREQKSMWSKPASLMLKAEIYLWSSRQLNGGQNDAKTAKDALLDIQTNVTDLGLTDNFSEIFDYSKKGNKEIILAIRNKLNEKNLHEGRYSSNLLPGALYIRNYYDENGSPIDIVAENNYGSMRLQIKTDNYLRFNDKDSRKRTTMKAVYSYIEKEGNTELKLVGTYPKKYPGTMNGSVRVAADDYPVYRYAELLLMLAEAKAILGEDPSNEINLIRKRAFGNNYDESVAYPNQPHDANVNDAILEERFLEFILEGKRWYDLRRFGNEYVFKYTLADPQHPLRLLWPIDVTTLNRNQDLNQTPGY